MSSTSVLLPSFNIHFMDNQENEFSPEQSLKLITSMIETTKNSISDNSFYFLLWGWGTLIGCSLQYYLKAILNNPNNAMAWLIIPVLAVLQIFLVFKKRRKEKVKTFISNASSYLWTAIGFAYLTLIFIFAKIGWDNCYTFCIILYGIGTYVSGQLIKFRPLINGSIVCFPLALAAVYVDFNSRILILGIAVLVSYIIPGHLLRSKYKKQNVLNV